MKLVQRGKKMKQPKREPTENNEVEAQHKCTECAMVFQRRYALIMHTLKHERSKDYKCPVSCGFILVGVSFCGVCVVCVLFCCFFFVCFLSFFFFCKLPSL